MELINCFRCGETLPSDARFCFSCGAPQQEHSLREPIPQKLRFEVLKRDNFTCTYCGRTPPEVQLEIDHMLPVSSGGKNELTNLTTSCVACNRGKGPNLLSDSTYLQMEENRIAQQHQYDREIKLVQNAVDNFIRAKAKVFHCFWGYPVIPDASNPYFRFLRRQIMREYSYGVTEDHAKLTASSLIVTKPSMVFSREKQTRMQERYNLADLAHDHALEAREAIRQVWLDAEHQDVEAIASTELETADEDLERMIRHVVCMDKRFWDWPIYPDEDCAFDIRYIEIIGLL